jgi:protein involved in polysaccharide export with SLBB domain
MASGAVLLRNRPAGTPPTEDALRSVDGILKRLNETVRAKDTGGVEPGPLLHGLLSGGTRRVVVDLEAALDGDPRQDADLEDGDLLHLPRRMDSVLVAGEVATAFSTFHLRPGDRVRDLLRLAGGYTRNADQSQIRLLRASGRVEDRHVERAVLRPGDALLVPQKFRKDVPWQDTLMAFTPLALLYDAIRH